MTKWFILFLITSLTLTSCSIDWNGEKDKEITLLKNQVQENNFKKKQECASYIVSIKARLEKEVSGNNNIMRNALNEIFYSNRKNTCYANISKDYRLPINDKLIESHVIIDLLTGEETYYTTETPEQKWIFSKAIQDLKETK